MDHPLQHDTYHGSVERERGLDLDAAERGSALMLLPLSLKMGDTKVYEPYIRALLGSASHLCVEVALNSRTIPNCASIPSRILRREEYLDTAEGGVARGHFIEHSRKRPDVGRVCQRQLLLEVLCGVWAVSGDHSGGFHTSLVMRHSLRL